MSAPLLITDTTISGVLKNVYTKFRTQAFPILTPLLANAKKLKPGMASARWGGNGVYFDVVLTRPTGMTFSDAGYFPPSAAATEKQGNIGIKRSYVSRVIDALAIQGTANSEAGFVPLARKIMQEAMDAAKLGQQEALHGDGRGVKALVGSVTNTTTIVCTSPYGLAGAGQGGLTLDVGMTVAFRDTTGATLRNGAYQHTITSATVSGDNVTIVFTPANNAVQATDLVVASTASDDAYNRSVNGLINISNRGAGYNALHGIDASTYARWNAVTLTAGTDTPDANQPNEMDVWKLAQLVASKSGKDPMTAPDEFLLLTTPGIIKRVAESFLPQRQWQMAPKVELKGGFKAVQVCGLNMVADYWCPAGTVYLLHLPSLIWVDLMDFQPLSYQGVGPWRFVAGRDAYEYDFGAYWNFGVIQRNAHGSIVGYTDTERYTHAM